MNPDLLTRAGPLLHGDLWRSALARDLGVCRRTMHRWLAGEFAISDEKRAELVKLLQTRAMKIQELFTKEKLDGL